MNTSIIITVFNRSNFLDILLRFFFEKDKFIKIIVCDNSSEKNFIKKNRKLVNNYKKISKNIKYFYKNSSFANILYEACKTVDTKFCKVISDDDFCSEEFLKNSELFLLKNNSYSLVVGEIESFSYINKKIIINSNYFHQQNFFYLKKLSSPELEERIFYVNNIKNFSTIYAFFRTKDLLKILNVCNYIDNQLYDLNNKSSKIKKFLAIHTMELIFKIVSIFLGRIKFINNIMLYRIYHSSNFGSFSKKMSFYDYNFNNNILRLRYYLAKNLFSLNKKKLTFAKLNLFINYFIIQRFFLSKKSITAITFPNKNNSFYIMKNLINENLIDFLSKFFLFFFKLLSFFYNLRKENKKMISFFNKNLLN